MNFRRRAIAAVGLGITVGLVVAGHILYSKQSTSHAESASGASQLVARRAQDTDGQTSAKERAESALKTAITSPPTPAKTGHQRSLKAEIADLQAKAEAGDVHAASQLFRDVGRCNNASQVQWRTMNVRDRLASAPIDPTDPPDVQANRSDKIASLNRAADELAYLCDGVGPEVLGALPEITLQAARSGDPNARACYIHRGPLVSPQAVVSDPTLYANYPINAQRLLDDGIAAGDWREVIILQHAYSETPNYLRSGITGFDPVMAYRYKRLYSLGLYDDDGAKDDEPQLAWARQGLSDAEIATADQWAQTTFAEHFKNSGDSRNAVPANWDACSFDIAVDTPNP